MAIKLTLTVQIEGEPPLKVRSMISDKVLAEAKMGEVSMIAKRICSMAPQVEHFLNHPPIPCATMYSEQSDREKGEK